MSDMLLSLDAIGQIFHVIPDLATPLQVETSLRGILNDAALELYWWDWERECYVDVRDDPATPQAQPPRVVTWIEYESRKVGAMTHDARLLDTSEFLDSFVPMMRIAMERDRLHRDLTAKLDQLRASRQRIAEAADLEQRRLQRNLHDGAQQRLVVLLLTLRGLEAQAAPESELADQLRRAREEVEGTIEDLRELARGLHPPLLAQRGLAAAIRAGASRSSMPIQLDIRIEGELPPAVEAAAYYVCAEAVTNAVKHAGCSTIHVNAVRQGGVLTVEVVDDGVGGASFDGDGTSTGLRGLRDRVEAVDAVLTVESASGRGTRVAASFPLTG